MFYTSEKRTKVYAITIGSRDIYCPGYLNKIQMIREEHWYDVHPYSLAVWPHFFTDKIRRGKWWLRRENYPCIALELQTEGETCYRIAEKDTIVHPGELFVTVPGSNVRISDNGGVPGRQLQVIISGGMVKMLTEALGMMTSRCLTFADAGELESVRRRFFRIADLMVAKQYDQAPENSHLGYEFLGFLALHYSRAEMRDLPPLLTKAVWTMESDRSCRLSISQLAKELGISRATLTRLFQDYLGVTPHAHWNRLRMESAKQLVGMGLFSFKEIAGKLGFQNSLYFSTAFRQYTGMTPSEFRNGNRGEKKTGAQRKA